MILKLNIGINNMKDTQQLVKKSSVGRYDNIFPKTYLDAIKDRETNTSLIDILSHFNMYYLPYVGNQENTRLQIISKFRRTGLWVTYIEYDGTVTSEWYASEDMSDDAWKDSENWRLANNSLVGDITISSDGYWVINGVVTNNKAQGDIVRLRINTSTGYIQYSYDEKVWIDLVPFSELTPDIQVGTVNTLAAGSKASITKSGTNTKPVLNFNIPMGNTGAKGEKGDAWSIKGWVNDVDMLPSTGTLGDTYLVGTAGPYEKWVWKDNISRWVNIGQVTEIRASIFDGGRADTQYGGAREINCGGADAYLT